MCRLLRAKQLLWPLRALNAAEANLFPWIAVLIGCGIGVWFSVAAEPGPGSYALATLVLGAAMTAAWRGPDLARPLALLRAPGLASHGAVPPPGPAPPRRRSGRPSRAVARGLVGRRV